MEAVVYRSPYSLSSSGVRGGFGVFKPPPRNSEGPPKSCQTQPDCENLKIAEFRTPAHQDVRKKGSKILKLPRFAIVLHLQWQIIINSLKVPKIKKILLYEMKFLVPICSCLQNPWLGGYVRRSPFSLSPVLNWIFWTPPRKKIPVYATVK